MNWTRKDEFHSVSDEGYLLRVFKSGNVVKFCAWAPKVKVFFKMHYALGEGVPEESKHLGCHDRPAEAIAACVCHLEAINSEVSNVSNMG